MVGNQIYREWNTVPAIGKIVAYESIPGRSSSKNGCISSYYQLEIVEKDKTKRYRTSTGDCGFERPLNQPLNILYKPGNTQSVVINDISWWLPVAVFSGITISLSCYSVYNLLRKKRKKAE